MSEDLRHSIFLWVGMVAFVGLFWAALYFDIAPGIPDHWHGPMVGAAIALNVLKIVWDAVRNRKFRDR